MPLIKVQQTSNSLGHGVCKCLINCIRIAIGFLSALFPQSCWEHNVLDAACGCTFYLRRQGCPWGLPALSVWRRRERPSYWGLHTFLSTLAIEAEAKIQIWGMLLQIWNFESDRFERISWADVTVGSLVLFAVDNAFSDSSMLAAIIICWKTIFTVGHALISPTQSIQIIARFRCATHNLNKHAACASIHET